MSGGAAEFWRKPGFHLIAGLLGFCFAALAFVPLAGVLFSGAANPYVQHLLSGILTADNDHWILAGLFALLWAAGFALTYLTAAAMLARQYRVRSY